MESINFYEEFGPAAFTAKFRAEGMYNFGPSLSPTNAFHILQGMETLPLRMQRHMDNTAKMLASCRTMTLSLGCAIRPCPTIPDMRWRKMTPRGAGSIIVFGLKGGRDAGRAFIESVELHRIWPT